MGSHGSPVGFSMSLVCLPWAPVGLPWVSHSRQRIARWRPCISHRSPMVVAWAWHGSHIGLAWVSRWSPQKIPWETQGSGIENKTACETKCQIMSSVGNIRLSLNHVHVHFHDTDSYTLGYTLGAREPKTYESQIYTPPPHRSISRALRIASSRVLGVMCRLSKL